jgi:hypothetical protein
MITTAYVLGHPLIRKDSRPLRLLNRFRKTFPRITFIPVDPTETFEPAPDLVLIDTVIGIPTCRVYSDLADFGRSSSVSVHDYDLYLHLALLQKIGKIGKVLIFAVCEERFETDSGVIRRFRDLVIREKTGITAT